MVIKCHCSPLLVQTLRKKGGHKVEVELFQTLKLFGILELSAETPCTYAYGCVWYILMVLFLIKLMREQRFHLWFALKLMVNYDDTTRTTGWNYLIFCGFFSVFRLADSSHLARVCVIVVSSCAFVYKTCMPGKKSCWTSNTRASGWVSISIHSLHLWMKKTGWSRGSTYVWLCMNRLQFRYTHQYDAAFFFSFFLSLSISCCRCSFIVIACGGIAGKS